MPRWFMIVLIAGVVSAAPVALLVAQDPADPAAMGAEPAMPMEGAEPAGDTAAAPAAEAGETLPDGWSGPGFYLSWPKMLGCWLLFLLWVHTTDWVSTDAQEYKLNWQRWNPIVFGVFFGAFVLAWLIPMFWVGFPLLFIAYVAPLIAYILYRNGKVMQHEKVLTRSHLRYLIAGYLSMVGVKVKAERADPHESGPPVILESRGGATERDDNANLLLARQTPGFRDARQAIADGLIVRADAILLEYTQEAMIAKHLVDGVWHEGEAKPREIGDPLLVSLKTLCGLKAEDRQGRQEGKFTAKYENSTFAAILSSQGTKTGERVMMQFEKTKTRFKTLDELGMRPKMQEQVAELMALPKGFVLFSAMPANGLRTMTNIVLRGSDRFMREFMAVEEETNRYEAVENVMIHTYKAAEKKTPADVLPDLFLMEPNVVIVRDLVNSETIDMMCKEISKKRLMIATIRAKDAPEALLRVLAMKPSQAEFARAATAVLCCRLIRKLCDECKEAYQPAPEVLQQLGLPPDRVQAFYRPPQQPEQVCPNCKGIGYVGRTGIFEVLMVQDPVRQVLASTPKLDLLRQAARKSGFRSFQEEGLFLVAKGVTSLPELMRVLKQ
ncbi:MAG: Flp pilus assembly complex ATPase component TadA [Rhodopirellula sp.]|nr:Flp pilus assembly complex ATPase component TadA [Rhodopirellula sp.]